MSPLIAYFHSTIKDIEKKAIRYKERETVKKLKINKGRERKETLSRIEKYGSIYRSGEDDFM